MQVPSNACVALCGETVRASRITAMFTVDIDSTTKKKAHALLHAPCEFAAKLSSAKLEVDMSFVIQVNAEHKAETAGSISLFVLRCIASQQPKPGFHPNTRKPRVLGGPRLAGSSCARACGARNCSCGSMYGTTSQPSFAALATG
jgi:hypothetical protein